MSNKSGSAYGVTILCPIKNKIVNDKNAVDGLRDCLRKMPLGENSLFCQVPDTHFARLSIIDDVFYQGSVAREDHLKSSYLWFNSNFDGDLTSYLESMYDYIPHDIEEIWQYCVAFPGIAGGREKWMHYMFKCQIETTFFFAAVNDMTVDEVLRGLMLKQELSAFVAEHQGQTAADIKKDYMAFMENYTQAPTPRRGSLCYQFQVPGKTS